MEIVADPRLLEECDRLTSRTASLETQVETVHHYQILKASIGAAISIFPGLERKLERLVIIYSERREDEAAELFHHVINGWSLKFHIHAETLTDAPSFRRFVLHEFSHAADMLNPDFKYVWALHEIQCNARSHDSLRDGFRCLWDVCIDGFLSRIGEHPLQHREWHELSFLRHFGTSDFTRLIFSRLWNGEFLSKPTGLMLLNAAKTPAGLCALVGLQLRDIQNVTAIFSPSGRERKSCATLVSS